MPSVPIVLPFDAYRGVEPFIFVSYAHEDGQLIFPELLRLHKLGYRIWYDEGIDPGNEWPEEIANAIDHSAFFLVFITPRAVESTNVRNEINFALNKKKPFLAIHAEETKLPVGLELRMGDLQAILRWRMTEESYFRKIGKTLPQNLNIIHGQSGPVIEIEEGHKDYHNIKSSKAKLNFKSIIIGNQEWMTENLDVDHYCNGDVIPQSRLYDDWNKLKTGAWCYYEDNPYYSKEKYGRLYNWYAINDPRGLAPHGWLVPGDEEWQTLIEYLGGDKVAGNKLKQNGPSNWLHPNAGATNESGFTALPGGYRRDSGTYGYMGNTAYFWSSTQGDNYVAWSYILHNYGSHITCSHYYKCFGFSVRCIKDKL